MRTLLILVKPSDSKQDGGIKGRNLSKAISFLTRLADAARRASYSAPASTSTFLFRYRSCYEACRVLSVPLSQITEFIPPYPGRCSRSI